MNDKIELYMLDVAYVLSAKLLSYFVFQPIDNY